MALTRERKDAMVSEVSGLLETSKLSIAAKYPGLTVRDLQTLRRQAAETGTTVKVVKNRLFIRAMQSRPQLKDADAELLKGQLLYAFNSDDEVAPAQAMAAFAKTQPALEMVVGYDQDGKILLAEDLKMLADLPSKDELRAQVVGTVAAPLSGFASVVAANVRGVLNVLNARKESLES